VRVPIDTKPAKKILFDCDTGGDDAIALMMLLSSSMTSHPVGITTVTGNTNVHNVAINNLRILKLFGKLGEVPVYLGSKGPILPSSSPQDAASAEDVFGNDGMGNQPLFEPAASNDLLKFSEKEHAAVGIITLSKQYPGELVIVATGPLTNLALAVSMDPKLPSRLKALYIMGGSLTGKGNMTPAAEFNFYMDPEAAYTTLHKFSRECDTHLIDWDLCSGFPLDDDWVGHWLGAGSENQTKKQGFTEMALSDVITWYNTTFGADSLAVCDANAMAVALNPKVVIGQKKVNVSVELGGNLARGAMIVDHYSVEKNFAGPVTVYDKMKMRVFKDMLTKLFD